MKRESIGFAKVKNQSSIDVEKRIYYSFRVIKVLFERNHK